MNEKRPPRRLNYPLWIFIALLLTIIVYWFIQPFHEAPLPPAIPAIPAAHQARAAMAPPKDKPVGKSVMAAIVANQPPSAKSPTHQSQGYGDGAATGDKPPTDSSH